MHRIHIIKDCNVINTHLHLHCAHGCVSDGAIESNGADAKTHTTKTHTQPHYCILAFASASALATSSNTIISIHIRTAVKARSRNCTTSALAVPFVNLLKHTYREMLGATRNIHIGRYLGHMHQNQMHACQHDTTHDYYTASPWHDCMTSARKASLPPAVIATVSSCVHNSYVC